MSEDEQFSPSERMNEQKRTEFQWIFPREKNPKIFQMLNRYIPIKMA